MQREPELFTRGCDSAVCNTADPKLLCHDKDTGGAVCYPYKTGEGGNGYYNLVSNVIISKSAGLWLC